MLKLSIIIPVYQVEKYIRPCLESVFKQDLNDEDFEVIIVNDGTKDKSMEVIAGIIAQHQNITVINQENQGLSVARNNGIAIAKGEYLLMPDSDDLLVENSIRPLLELALKSKADLVVADFLKMSSREIDNFIGFVQQQEMTMTKRTGRRIFLELLNPYECYVWRTLYNRKFIVDNQLKFIPGIRFQDIPFTYEVYLKAKVCLRTSWILNIYRIGRDGAATNGFDLNKTKDFSKAIRETWELTHLKGLPNKIVEKLKDNIHANVSGIIYAMHYSIHDFSEKVKLVKMLRQELPLDIRFNHNLLQRVETILFWHMPYLYVFIREIICKWKNH